MRKATDRSVDGPRKARKPRKGTYRVPAWSGPCGHERYTPDGFSNTEHTETDRGNGPVGPLPCIPCVPCSRIRSGLPARFRVFRGPSSDRSVHTLPRLRLGAHGPRISVLERLPPADLGLGLPTDLGLVGKLFRIDAHRAMPAASRTLASPSSCSAFWSAGMASLASSWNSPSLRAELRRTSLALCVRPSINAGTTFAASSFPRGKRRAALTPSISVPDFRSAINSSVDFCWLQPAHASKPSNRTKPVCTRINQVLRLKRGEKQGEWPASAGLWHAARGDQ